MTIWWLVVILGFIGSAGIGFIWLIVFLDKVVKGKSSTNNKSATDSIDEAAKSDVEHIFNDDFREELRNRGRLHFEKIITENADFLQQDLRLTVSEISNFMKDEITNKLKVEFANYQQSIGDAKQLAVDSIQRTKVVIEDERKNLSEQVKQEVSQSKALRLKQFEDNMDNIINHYVLAAIGDQIDLSDQLEYILSELEANKKSIIEDIKNGA
jgi:hypothetical protein